MKQYKEQHYGIYIKFHNLVYYSTAVTKITLFIPP